MAYKPLAIKEGDIYVQDAQSCLFYTIALKDQMAIEIQVADGELIGVRKGYSGFVDSWSLAKYGPVEVIREIPAVEPTPEPAEAWI